MNNLFTPEGIELPLFNPLKAFWVLKLKTHTCKRLKALDGFIEI